MGGVLGGIYDGDQTAGFGGDLRDTEAFRGAVDWAPNAKLPGKPLAKNSDRRSLASVGDALLAHVARVQRVRNCFENAIRRVEERWHARLSKIGESLTVRHHPYTPTHILFLR